MHNLLTAFLFFAEMPVPRDLPLALPLSEEVLRALIVPAFLIHILFVNLMVGASVMTVIFEIVGLKYPRFDRLAYSLADTITVNKSLAVVLGIAPLLLMNLLYTSAFYSANVLTGHAWVLLVPLITSAFLLSYVHKYTWDRWNGFKKRRHITVGVLVGILFLLIPLIFLANVNLMLFPSQWSEVSGFFSSLRVGNVFPRYFHFLSASLAMTGLFMTARFGWKRLDVPQGFERVELMRHFYRWVFYVSCAQFMFGPLMLLTLPVEGLTMSAVRYIMAGAAIAVIALLFLNLEIRSRHIELGWRFSVIAVCFSLTVFAMGYGRHLYREKSLSGFKDAMENRTKEFAGNELGTQMRLSAGLGAGDALTGPPSGKAIFAQVCGSCHRVEGGVDAPPLTEIYSLYQDNPGGIVKWSMQPGKKRQQFPQMPSMAHLGEENLTMVAAYMLELGRPQEEISLEEEEGKLDKLPADTPSK